MITSKLVACCGAGAAVFACTTPLIAASARPTYQSCAQFISELGETGAPDAVLVNYVGFLPTGVLTILFAWLAAARVSSSGQARGGLLLFSGVGFAYVVAAFSPCDPGCPVSGSSAQQLHNAFGFVEYVGGGLGVLLVGTSPRMGWRMPGEPRFSLACSVVVWSAFVGMLLPQLASVRGLLQRVAEAALFLWMLDLSASLWRSGRPRTAPSAL